MNNLILYLQFMVFFNTQNDTLCKEQFYQAALKDTSYTSMVFLKLNVVDSDGTDEYILMPNHTLYHLLRKESGLDYNEYKTFMKDVLSLNRKLRYSQYGKLSGSIRLKKDNYVERIAKKGREKLIKRFFKNDVFLYSKYQNHFESVVGKLFDMGVLISLVDNGAFAITYKSECQ